jgi:Xaa-Pro aminopeptidase
MSDLHFVSVNSEKVDPKFLREGMLTAREKSWEAFQLIKSQLKEGLTEGEAREVCLQVLKEKGAEKHWHRPYVRLGKGTALSFHDPVQPSYRLQKNDPVYIDLGPVWKDSLSGLEYEGDVGDTFVFGKYPDAERCALRAQQIFVEAQEKWRAEKCSGSELYSFIEKRANDLGYQLLEKVDGHRLGDYPHTKYSKERLAKVEFNPTTCLWVLEVQLLDPDKRFGAFYEDLLL